MKTRRTLIITLAAALLMCLLFFMFFIRPKQGDLGRVRDEVVAAEAEEVALGLELARLKALQPNAPERDAQLTEVNRYVPPRNEVPNFIFQVEEAALEAGVAFVQIGNELPEQPAEGAELAQVRVTIGADGEYFAIQDFMRRLYDLDRAVRIDVVTMTAEEAQGPSGPSGETSIALDITARIFFEKPEAAPPAGEVPPPPAPSPTPGAVTPTPAP